MVGLGVVEGRLRADGRGDRAVARRRQARLVGVARSLRRAPFGLLAGEDHGPVLSADVVPLTHSLGRVVALPEQRQQLVEGDRGRVVDDQHDLGVSRPAAAHLLVRRVGRHAAGIPDRRRVDAGPLPEHALRPPETAQPEHRAARAFREGRDDRPSMHEVRRRNRHRLGSARQRLRGGRQTQTGGIGEKHRPSSHIAGRGGRPASQSIVNAGAPAPPGERPPAPPQVTGARNREWSWSVGRPLESGGIVCLVAQNAIESSPMSTRYIAEGTRSVALLGVRPRGSGWLRGQRRRRRRRTGDAPGLRRGEPLRSDRRGRGAVRGGAGRPCPAERRGLADACGADHRGSAGRRLHQRRRPADGARRGGGPASTRRSGSICSRTSS